MPFIRCTRKNASHEISGVAFKNHPEGGVVSVEEVDDDLAAMFLSVPGYEVVEVEPEETPAQKKAREKAEAKAKAEAAAAQKKADDEAKAAADAEQKKLDDEAAAAAAAAATNQQNTEE